MKTKEKNDISQRMWIKIPNGLSEAIREIEPDEDKWAPIYGAYHEVVATYQDKRGQNDYVTLNQIAKDHELDSESKKELLDIVSHCKWVFHTKKTATSKNIKVKPVIFVDDINRKKCEAMLEAMKQKNYQRLLKLSPMIRG